MIVVVMGVSGCGKSSVGQAIASELGWTFIEGDDLHPVANRDKMAAGTPLDDDDRWPWLDRIAAEARSIDQAAGSVVIACSALKRIYRERLNRAGDGVLFLHLAGDRAVIQQRMAARADHFMPPGLLDSQLAALQPPDTDENAIVFDISNSVGEIAATALNVIKQENK